MPTTDIVLRTYQRDLGWAAYCLRSVRRFCRGFRRVLLVVPESCRERVGRFDAAPAEVVFCPVYADDYLGQQVTKLTADRLTDAEFVVHVDADCTFRRRVTPADLIPGGRPEVLITPAARFAGDAPWRAVTERVLGRPVGWDYMRRQPLAYPRWLYPAVRERIAAAQGCDATDYVLRQPPLGFSEFNALGAVAHAEFAAAFAWREWPSDGFDETFCRIHWSWGGLTDAIRRELDGILADDPATGGVG